MERCIVENNPRFPQRESQRQFESLDTQVAARSPRRQRRAKVLCKQLVRSRGKSLCRLWTLGRVTLKFEQDFKLIGFTVRKAREESLLLIYAFEREIVSSGVFLFSAEPRRQRRAKVLRRQLAYSRGRSLCGNVFVGKSILKIDWK